VFPAEPERSVYNNALLDRFMPATARRAALDVLERTYTEAGIGRFAAWVHESDAAMRSDIEQRGYALDTSTRVMGMGLDQIRVSKPDLELGQLSWSEYVRVFGLPPGLLGGGDRAGLRVLVARAGDEDVATAMAFDYDEDAGIYNVATLEHARRRGLGTALTALHLHDAVARGCRTASVQSTPMAEGVYAAVGFIDLGRYLEYVPGPSL
jgi:ribosomal protein S18 acetylase RimI-like enzyme